MMPFVAGNDELIHEARADISAILTRPFGEVDLKETMRNGPRGAEDPKAKERMRQARKMDRIALKTGVADSDFGQANFLLFKQLLYFDRYGKMYLADDALMGNRAFLEKVLAECAPNS
jgi:hypothetical protein